jgi:hypothetical protein
MASHEQTVLLRGYSIRLAKVSSVSFRHEAANRHDAAAQEASRGEWWRLAIERNMVVILSMLW